MDYESEPKKRCETCGVMKGDAEYREGLGSTLCIECNNKAMIRVVRQRAKDLNKKKLEERDA